MTTEFRKFPESWPYVNPHGIIIEKSEVDSFLKELYSNKTHFERFKNRGVEMCSVLLWAMERTTIPQGLASLAYAGCKTMFKSVPKLDRDWKAALIVKRRNSIRRAAAREGRSRPTNEELREQEKEMFRLMREQAFEALSGEDPFLEDLKLLRISYDIKALPGESLKELVAKPLNRQAEKIEQIKKRFEEQGWIK